MNQIGHRSGDHIWTGEYNHIFKSTVVFILKFFFRLGHREIFEELVSRGARLDLRDFYNQMPLWFAVKEQRLPFVRALLKAGAPIQFDRATENPLNIAVQFLSYRVSTEE